MVNMIAYISFDYYNYWSGFKYLVQEIAAAGVTMVSFRRYVDSRDYPEGLKDILAILAAHRQLGLTVDDVHSRLPSGTKRDTVHDQLESGVKKGLIEIVESPPYTKKRGHPPKRYGLNMGIWEEYQESERTPERMERGFAASVILRAETKEDRERMEAAGIVHCPSCGNPVPKSDIIRIAGAEKDSCLTEYVQVALKGLRFETMKDGSCKITVEGSSELAAIGRTEDECRINLIEQIKKWIDGRLSMGLDIPPLND